MSGLVEHLSRTRGRALLLEPGDALMFRPNPIEVISDFSPFLEVTGVPFTHVVTSRLCALPVPRGPIRAVPGVRAEVAWLPLFWLLPQLAARTQHVIGDDGLTLSLAQASLRGVRSTEKEGGSLAGPCRPRAQHVGAVRRLDGHLPRRHGPGRHRPRHHGRPQAGAAVARTTTLTTMTMARCWRSGCASWWAGLGAGRGACQPRAPRPLRPGSGGASLVETLFELEAGVSCGQVSLTATKLLMETVCLSAATWIQNLAPEEWGGDPRTGPEDRWWLARCESAQDFTGASARLVEDHLGPAIRRLAAIGRFTPPLADAYLGERDEEDGAAEV